MELTCPTCDDLLAGLSGNRCPEFADEIDPDELTDSGSPQEWLVAVMVFVTALF